VERIREALQRCATRKHLEEIPALTSTQVELYRKFLYVALLDTLAGAAMPTRKSLRQRFVAFIQRFCHWPDGERISLPHLMQLLRKTPDPAFEKLRKWTIAKYKAMPAFLGEFTPISSDPTFEEVRTLWPVAADHRTPLENAKLESLKHRHLLYTLRSSLVHELRTLGYGMEFGQDSVPHYHKMSTELDDGSIHESAEIVYPEKFLHKLCDTGLTELERYFAENELSPYGSFVFGSYWLQIPNR
jgi:hypothetical protein